MAVEILESCMVTPSEASTPKHGVWLSNLDLLVARSHTPTIYVYRPTSHVPAFFSPDVLKAALSKALVPFYPLAGRLALDGAGRPEIHCTGDGVLFVTARTDAALQDLGGFVPSDELRRMLVPSADGGGGDERAGILAMFQVTFFKCGGVCVGAAIHHTAADGLAALDFVNTWAAVARGAAGEAAPRLPWLDRTLLRARSPPAVRFDHAEYSRRGGGGSKVPFDSAILPLSKAQVDALKGGKKLSTFKAVVAHVWRCACRARGLAAAAETRLYMTADARSRVTPPLPDGYLGNAIFRASAVAKVGDVVSGPLDAAADRISGATARLDDEYVRSLVDHLEQVVSDAAGLRKGEWVMPETDLWVISWQGLPIYDADFGWGRPSFMSRACLQFSGLVYLVPGPDGDGRLDVVVAMEPKSLARFKELLYDDL
jgi:shikimate O-hydroxycinnamoyltransferase